MANETTENTSNTPSIEPIIEDCLQFKTYSRSPDIGALAAALAKAQGEMTGAVKNRENAAFKTQAGVASRYADLDAVRAACIPALTKNNIAVVQIPTALGAKVSLTTILMHCSGQWIEGTLEVTALGDKAQAVGACVTYCRRFALGSFSSVASEDDDDGNTASGTTAPAPRASSAAPAPAEDPALKQRHDEQVSAWMTMLKGAQEQAQLDAITKEIKDAKWLAVPAYRTDKEKLTAAWVACDARLAAKRAEQAADAGKEG